MSRPEIDTMDGVIYHGEDIAEKRYKRTSEITQCPLWWANTAVTMVPVCIIYQVIANYCCHPAARKKENEDNVSEMDRQT